MSLLQQYETARDQRFQAVVRMALLAQARAVLDEPDTTPAHDARLAFAKRLLSVPQQHAERGFLEVITERACELLALAGLSAASDEALIVQAIAGEATLIARTFAPPPAPAPAAWGGDDAAC